MNWIKTNGTENVPAHGRDVLIYIHRRKLWTKAWWLPSAGLWSAEDNDGGEDIAPGEVSHYCEITPPGEADDVQALIAYVKEQAFDGVDYECGVTYQTEKMEELIRRAEGGSDE